MTVLQQMPSMRRAWSGRFATERFDRLPSHLYSVEICEHTASAPRMAYSALYVHVTAMLVVSDKQVSETRKECFSTTTPAILHQIRPYLPDIFSHYRVVARDPVRYSEKTFLFA